MATATYLPSNETSEVVQALENPKYVWRTLDGLAHDAKLPKEKVAGILSQLPSDMLVSTPSRKGQLYSTRQHYAQRRSFKSRVLSVLSDMPK